MVRMRLNDGTKLEYEDGVYVENDGTYLQVKNTKSKVIGGASNLSVLNFNCAESANGAGAAPETPAVKRAHPLETVLEWGDQAIPLNQIPGPIAVAIRNYYDVRTIEGIENCKYVRRVGHAILKVARDERYEPVDALGTPIVFED